MATLIIIGLLLILIIGLVVLGAILNEAYKEWEDENEDENM